MLSEPDRLRIENKALWKLVETLFSLLASKAPELVQQFTDELEKLKK